jgi:quinol monooxygenase YgiN
MHVFLHIKPEFLEPFLEATYDNARNSVQEPGCKRFDVLQQDDDPTRIVLVETYLAPEDLASHRETAHFFRWRDTVSEMFVEPRYLIKYNQRFPAIDAAPKEAR